MKKIFAFMIAMVLFVACGNHAQNGETLGTPEIDSTEVVEEDSLCAPEVDTTSIEAPVAE